MSKAQRLRAPAAKWVAIDVARSASSNDLRHHRQLPDVLIQRHPRHERIHDALIPPRARLQAKISSALEALTSGNLSSACGSLNALTNHLDAHPGKRITVSDARTLIASAERIRTVAGC